MGAVIKDRVDLLGSTCREVSIAATGSPDAIRTIASGSLPSVDRFFAIARELRISPIKLYEESTSSVRNGRAK
jgi:hypothetical protein